MTVQIAEINRALEDARPDHDAVNASSLALGAERIADEETVRLFTGSYPVPQEPDWVQEAAELLYP